VRPINQKAKNGQSESISNSPPKKKRELDKKARKKTTTKENHRSFGKMALSKKERVARLGQRTASQKIWFGARAPRMKKAATP